MLLGWRCTFDDPSVRQEHRTYESRSIAGIDDIRDIAPRDGLHEKHSMDEGVEDGLYARPLFVDPSRTRVRSVICKKESQKRHGARCT